MIKGKYRVRLAKTEAEVARAQGLRQLRFNASDGAAGGDRDAFDPLCQHVLVEEMPSETLVCCYRLMMIADGPGLARSYSAQFYDLSGLMHHDGPLLELGRFCLHPDWHDPDILRLAWAAMARMVDAAGVKLLFGCSSFEGAAVDPHTQALALLKAHLAPPQYMPAVKAPQIYPFAAVAGDAADPRRAWAAMPPLLRTYLAMGGWVSDHAVIDPMLDTLHVFTGVEIATIPAARARALRAIAG
jgi:putative hemolysin